MTEFSALEKSIIKKYGDVLVPASIIGEQNKANLKIGPKLDLALCGGIPEGSRVVFSGPPKCGKSSSVMQIAANAIKDGRKVFYYDVENRFKKLNLYGIRDFDAEKMRLIHSTEDCQLTAEQYLEIAKTFIKAKENKGSVHIIDSVSALCPDSVMTAGDVSGSRRSTSPKLVKDFMNQVAGTLPVMNITVIAIHHLIANTSGYGVSEMEDGGRNMQYQADVKIRGGTPKKWEEGEKQIGIIATWDVIWSALGPSPGKVESYIRFNYGIDDIKETVELATDFGILKKGGSWYDLESLGITKKIQGDEQLLSYLKENPDLLKKIQDEFTKVVK